MSGRFQPTDGADSPQALRSFLPPPEYATYRVLLGVDDGERMTLEVHAIGQHSAAKLAELKAEDLGHFDVMALRVDEAA